VKEGVKSREDIQQERRMEKGRKGKWGGGRKKVEKGSERSEK